MKTIKKRSALALVLSLTIILTTLATSIAAFGQTPATNKTPMLISESRSFYQLKSQAIVKKPLKDGQLLVTVNDMEVALIITDETIIINSQTGLPASLEDIKANDTLFVHYSAAMTRSLPPQSRAIAIVTQIKENIPHAELFTVREIISRKDGEVRALNKEGGLIATFLEENPLTAYKTKQIVTIDDIQVGTQLFIWYDIVLMSYPGQTAAIKAVLVGQEEGLGVRAVYTPMAGADSATVTIQDKTIQKGDKNLLDQRGILMVPLRSVAEALGFTVVWNGKDQSIFLDDGTAKTTLYIGQDSYFKASSKAIGLTQNFCLGQAPTLIESTTFVPASLFNLLYSDNNAVKIEVK